MRIAARHRTLETQLAARERHRDQALQAEVFRNRAANEGLAEDEAVQPRYGFLTEQDDDEEPLPSKAALYQSEHGEDPLMAEAKAIAAHCAERAELVTEMISACVPFLLMAAKHAVSSVPESREYVRLYLDWRHAVMKLWQPPGEDWLSRMRCSTQRAMVERVESTPEFRAVRKLLDRARKSTDEYKASAANAERERRKKPKVRKANAEASKLRMQKYRARLAAERAAK